MIFIMKKFFIRMHQKSIKKFKEIIYGRIKFMAVISLDVEKPCV